MKSLKGVPVDSFHDHYADIKAEVTMAIDGVARRHMRQADILCAKVGRAVLGDKEFDLAYDLPEWKAQWAQAQQNIQWINEILTRL